MATMEKMGFGEKTEEEKQQELQAKKLEEEMKKETEDKEKKGFWSSLGTGVKVGLAFVGGALAVGLTWAATALLGGGDEEEPDKLEAPEETKEE